MKKSKKNSKKMVSNPIKKINILISSLQKIDLKKIWSLMFFAYVGSF